MSTSKQHSRQAYNGSRRKLVIAFDVGTTFSGISYCILDPGQIPGAKSVTRFPAQEASSGASKIPTIVFYDKKGKVQAVGAEAVQESVYETALEEGWYKAEWFKLHLRSKFTSAETLTEAIPDLPPNKSVIDVFADFLAYLMQCTSTYIRETYPNGDDLWDSFASATHATRPANGRSAGAQTDGIQFVLSHPNGWEGKEQTQMRQAALKAKLIPDNPEGHKRISFVTEGEASLHFAVENGLLAHASDGDGIVVVDAGGGTVDVSTYKRNGKNHQRIFEEVAVPKCYFYGSIFVTLAAKDFLRDKLSESNFIDDLDHITTCFDQTTKTRFRSAQDPQYIKFGSTRDNEPDVDVRFGQMKLKGEEVAKFFQPSIECVVQAVLEQVRVHSNKIKHVILVGGFAASDWLHQKVREKLDGKGITIGRPENNVNKAVSDGAISFHLDHFVRTRVAKVTYGCRTHTAYNSSNPEHIKRQHDVFTYTDETQRLKGRFLTILKKNTQVTEEQEFKQSLRRSSPDPNSVALDRAEVTVLSYRGELKDPQWIDEDKDNYTVLFTLNTNSELIPRKIEKTASGKTVFSVHYDVIILFGLTEIQAQLRWRENGVEKRTAATMIYLDA